MLVGFVVGFLNGDTHGFFVLLPFFFGLFRQYPGRVEFVFVRFFLIQRFQRIFYFFLFFHIMKSDDVLDVVGGEGAVFAFPAEDTVHGRHALFGYQRFVKGVFLYLTAGAAFPIFPYDFDGYFLLILLLYILVLFCEDGIGQNDFDGGVLVLAVFPGGVLGGLQAD